MTSQIVLTIEINHEQGLEVDAQGLSAEIVRTVAREALGIKDRNVTTFGRFSSAGSETNGVRSFLQSAAIVSAR